MKFRFITGLLIGLSFAAGIAYSAGNMAYFPTAPSATAGQTVCTTSTGDGSVQVTGCASGNVSTTGTNTYTTGTNAWNSGVSLASAPNPQTANYTMVAGDCGHAVVFTGAGPFTFTTITAGVPFGCSIGVVQGVGAGAVSVSPAATSINLYTKTKGPGAIIGLFYTPAGNWLLSGDGAP